MPGQWSVVPGEAGVRVTRRGLRQHLASLCRSWGQGSGHQCQAGSAKTTPQKNVAKNILTFKLTAQKCVNVQILDTKSQSLTVMLSLDH